MNPPARSNTEKQSRRQRLTPMEEKQISSALQRVWQESIHTFQKSSFPKEHRFLFDRLFGPGDTLCGIGAGILSFIALRSVRARLLPRLISPRSASSVVPHSPFQPSAWRRKQSPIFFTPFQADLKRESTKWKRFDLVLDFASCTCLGMTVYLWRRVQTLEQIAHFPAAHPSSALARQLCQVLMKELVRWQRNLQQDKVLSTSNLVELYRQDQVQDEYLRCYLQFADHCEAKNMEFI
ncbi:hypothetical protein FisN_9Lh314 [Fistulifera solaris]|uniref:Uncharacterized protein n=1 Tax=Fistulifera solaris TaxID=1519565 RepID=A0A1Z5KLU8_FISSO|nr:hypothetical protein FisN_9Lh314 [Fistulifera solaris]|eukprot:GAX27001.1 hypothetical protein FisN_9Lh314 [Fistulifera solaris]